MISFIWAMDKNGAIGKDNALPWRLPEDLKFFKETTMGHPIVMGRKTYESIGKPLPGRENIVVTRNPAYEADGCTVVHSYEELLERAKEVEELFVTGGGDVFKQMMPYADKLYVTYIDDVFEADTYFPEVIDWGEWSLLSEKKGEKNEKNPYDYYFRIYERKHS
ncbi:dihydrofolate reductase [Bacillus thermotolerans]|uniref:dihydrofolate reductase n=1 Tax=Bacillus thermotolerans TaxID=1221996 RepID=UPI00057CF8D4|nr:dihydrofolate reductase [Bacillus thermotolerans]KKB38525.1 Dihydrofolate reductase [Bacillus thermotolerans]KKB39941.1 Dihydrofolate reductase [Bacillus thermotolerans]